MDLYDKRYVYFEWDDSLEGKEVFFADCIDTLIARVNDGIGKTVDIQHVFGPCSCGSSSYPFSMTDIHYRFFYYDPLYEYKRAWKNGKQIQSRSTVYVDAEWVDDDYPDWNNSCEEFRIKPEELKVKRRKTNRELAKWLADNNGQVMYASSKFKCTEHSYTTNDDDPVRFDVLIRGWDEEEWHEPEVEE